MKIFEKLESINKKLESINKIKILKGLNDVVFWLLCLTGFVFAFLFWIDTFDIGDGTVGMGFVLLLVTPIVAFILWFIMGIVLDFLDDVRGTRIYAQQATEIGTKILQEVKKKNVGVPTTNAPATTKPIVEKKTASVQKKTTVIPKQEPKKEKAEPVVEEKKKPTIELDDKIQKLFPKERLEHFYNEGVITEDEMEKARNMSGLLFCNFLYNKDMISEEEYEKLTENL